MKLYAVKLYIIFQYSSLHFYLISDWVNVMTEYDENNENMRAVSLENISYVWIYL